MEQSDRAHMDLAVEKLKMVVDPASDPGSKTSAQLWLNQNLSSICKKVVNMEQDRPGRLCVEDASYRVYFVMARLIDAVCERDRWAPPNGRADLEVLENDLDKVLAGELARIRTIQDSAPAIGAVLRSLYSSYDLGRTAINFAAYLSRRDSNLGGDSARRRFAEYGRLLVEAVIEKSSMIKTGLDEGGWIDKVLESVLQVDRDVKDANHIGETVKKVVDENFMEEWAGQVVESWRDSAMGFSYFKPAV
jgi:N-terminal acetyltransferase B complex non-catalytic subunit